VASLARLFVVATTCLLGPNHVTVGPLSGASIRGPDHAGLPSWRSVQPRLGL